MQEIVEKRSQLLNYFFNESVKYSKSDILNKEYAALSFSPREEFIDFFITEYDDVLTPITDLKDDLPEVLIKGIIIDIDIKKNYAIIHIQNKADNISVSLDENVLYKYSQYLEKGHIVVIKGHTFNNKVYMHFLIDYSSNDSFVIEKDYLNGISERRVDDVDYANRTDVVGLVRQAKYFVSRKGMGSKCLRLEMHVKGQEKTYITCNNDYNMIPEHITAGMTVSFNVSNNPAFCNNVQEIII
jgi:hypothetical protein